MDPEDRDAPAGTLHDRFAAAVRRWPEAAALEVPPGRGRPLRQSLTYRELDALAESIARRLDPLVADGSLVAVLLARDSPRLAASQLAILRAGAAHVCLDPGFPDTQVARVLADAAPVALVTDAAGAARAAGWKAGAVVDLDAGPPALPPAPRREVGPGDLAYLIYTSGTTGEPKGVMVEHRSIAALVDSDLEAFGLGPGDRVAQNSSAAYDSSVEETWLALAAGATLVLMDEEAVRLGPDLPEWLRRERITVLCPPPTLLRTAGGEGPPDLPDLRLLYVGGEALTPDVAARWAPGRRLENGYGPTECTVTALRGPVEAGGPITIGRPVPSLRAWVLDGDLAEVPDGQVGELCLGGPGLARGYRGSPDLTAARFPVHPALGRIYRTGDLARKEADGRFTCLGRSDAQVKVRGHRIELEAVEARLAALPGVREAACTVQGDPPSLLVAFVVPEDPSAPPAEADLRAALARDLPAPMVPSRIGSLEALPRSLGGKLDRRRLPVLEAVHGPGAAPTDPLQARVAAALGAALPGLPAVPVDADFFTDLGGDSLSAARAVSLLREDPSTAGLAVRDLYEARTVAALAERARGTAATVQAPERATGADPDLAVRPLAVTVAQAAWLALGLVLGAPLAWAVGFRLLPALVHGLGLVPLLLLSPMLGLAGLGAWTLGAVALTVAVKGVLVGRAAAGRVPVWSGPFLRHWMVQQTARLIPWKALEGSQAHSAVLRALGARVGRRVHLHRGVVVPHGAWDLLDLGDDATLSQDSALRLVDYEDGCLVLGPVRVGAGATLETRAGMGPDTVLGDGAVLAALSVLAPGARVPSGERWSGVPAARTGTAEPAPAPEGGPDPSPGRWSAGLWLAEAALAAALALPAQALALAAAWHQGFDTRRVAAWLARPVLEPRAALALALLLTLSVPATLLLSALLCRGLGRVRPGRIGRWSWAYLRVWLKGGLVAGAGEWLSGTLFWPLWLRLAGMRLGRGCEISTILDVVPELVEIGPDSFFADGIYLGGPAIHQGTVTLAPLRLGSDTFLGNHAVLPGGRDFPPGMLLGVCTPVEATPVAGGSSWFGLPPFELPNREVVAMDRRLTHDPSAIRRLNRVLWEAARFALPVLPALATAAWAVAVAAAEARLGTAALLFAALPLLGLALAASFPLLILALKWALLGRVRPGVHPLWSCWCSRWDFLFVAWALYARAGLGALEHTLMLTVYLRAMGLRIGRRVVLGPGFTQVVDPDMLAFGDGATVTGLFQAHTFEDRVLKIDRVEIRAGAGVGSGAVLLYGADIGEGARVAPHSVVMKGERLLPGRRYAGCPTRPVD